MSEYDKDPLSEIRAQLFSMEESAQKVSPEQMDSKCIDCAELVHLQSELTALRERLERAEAVIGSLAALPIGTRACNTIAAYRQSDAGRETS